MEQVAEKDRRSTVRMMTLCAGLILLVVSLALGIAAGAVHISLADIWQAITRPGQTDNYRIIYTLRMPRAICAALAGANLALSGCILQGILRNPLADPGIIGISAGAGLAAMALMLIAPTLTAFVPFAAFFGAIIAAAIVFMLAYERGVNPLRLVLAGVAIAAFFGGGMTALSVFFSDKIQGTVSWMAGGFAGSNWQHVRMILPYSFVGIIGTLCYYRKLNALQLGDDVAKTLGVHTERTRGILVALAALLAASAVSVAGLLGFVGLIIPHVMRLVVGSDFETLLPCSALFGAILVVVADVAARTIFSPVEVPVGIFMSFIGAPFFLYLLKRRMRHA
ncbi:iron ABC transporter permease [uncultured Megasphaera sp.]|uniref:FecCD family ABC transporter permease n=1 Tax=uncultured Megasphaera sp. TaxID=165188 RepID=UPI002658F5AA|nr:iron ABC transporter permease [uncultured Megasphaera sp.]